MPRKYTKRFVRIRIRRQDGVVQRVKIKGKQRAYSHPQRVNKKGQYVNSAGPFHPLRLPPPSDYSQPAPRGSTAPATEPTRPPTRPPEPVAPAGRSGAEYNTWFKAAGSMDKTAGYKDAYKDGLMDEENEEFNAPSLFFSQQGALLGQVKWPGIKPLDELIDELNDKLQFLGEGTATFDFRDYYHRWSYEYQVIETLGPTDRITDAKRDSKP